MLKIADFCRKIADSEFFQSCILVLILMTAFSMGLETVPEVTSEFGDFFDAFFYISQTIFAFEILVRVLSYLPRIGQFFTKFVNIFDFTIVVLSFLPVIGSFILIARLLRALRVLRVMSVSDRLRSFISRLHEAVDEAAYSSIILLVLSYIFSIAGHYLFSEIDASRWGTLGQSFVSVFYLALLQDVPAHATPVMAVSWLHFLYFLVFYFVQFAFILCVINAAISQSVKGKNG